jgi:hypothetical protein
MKRVLIGGILAVLASAGALRAAWGVGEARITEVLPLEARERGRLARLVADEPDVGELFAAKQAARATWLERRPRAAEVLNYEGLLSDDARRLATVEHLEDSNAVAALLELWQVSGDPVLAAHMRLFLLAWAETYRPTGNDVNEDKLLPMIVAFASVRETFPERDGERVMQWLRVMGEKHVEQLKRSGPPRSNRDTKRLRLLAFLGVALARSEWVDVALARLGEFLAHGLKPDGTSYDLHHRDSLTYHVSALVPALDVAWLARKRGEERYRLASAEGASLQRSVQYLVPFADGSRTREEWRQSRVELDRRRAAAGLEAYSPGRLYDPTNALPVLEKATLWEPQFVPLVAKLAGLPGRTFPTWRCAVNSACD